jgi:hypothetical protein
MDVVKHRVALGRYAGRTRLSDERSTRGSLGAASSVAVRAGEPVERLRDSQGPMLRVLGQHPADLGVPGFGARVPRRGTAYPSHRALPGLPWAWSACSACRVSLAAELTRAAGGRPTRSGLRQSGIRGSGQVEEVRVAMDGSGRGCRGGPVLEGSCIGLGAPAGGGGARPRRLSRWRRRGSDLPATPGSPSSLAASPRPTGPEPRWSGTVVPLPIYPIDPGVLTTARPDAPSEPAPLPTPRIASLASRHAVTNLLAGYTRTPDRSPGQGKRSPASDGAHQLGQ